LRLLGAYHSLSTVRPGSDFCHCPPALTNLRGQNCGRYKRKMKEQSCQVV
jgi:hypothetical protein